MIRKDPLDAWEHSRVGRTTLGLREHYRGSIFGAVIAEREPATAHCRVGDRWLIDFGNAGALGLDQMPFFSEALASGACAWGTSCGASRVYQSTAVCSELEKKLAAVAGCEEAIVFNSVTTAHCGVLPAIARNGDVWILVDASAHNSVHRACDVAAARGVSVETFRHNAMDELQVKLARGTGVPLVAIDSIYSMTGEFAPLAELSEAVAERNGYLYIDDAHGTGLYGSTGGGYAAKVFGEIPPHVLIGGSLSKAVCGYGGFLGCTGRIRAFVECTAEGFLFNGPVPGPYLAADKAILDFMGSSEYGELLKKLEMNRQALLATLTEAGLEPISPESHILAVEIGDRAAVDLGRSLFSGGILANVALFPAVARGRGVVRFTPSVLHTAKDMEDLSRVLAKG